MAERSVVRVVVKGVKFYPGLQHIRDGQDISCHWEPGNAYDPNAVACFAELGGDRVMAGHLEGIAKILVPLLRDGVVEAKGHVFVVVLSFF